MSKIVKATCVICCLCLLVTVGAAPAFAVVQGNIDPSNYISSITQDGDIKTINYKFNTPYLWRYWDNKSQTAQELQDDLAYCVPAGATQIAITSFPFGRSAGPDQPATYGGVIIADILPNSPIDFSFEHDVHLQVTDAIRNIEITVVFEWGCYYYAEDGSYQGSIIMPTLTEKYSHETFTYLDAGKTLTGTFPAKAHHFIPWVRTTIYTSVLPSKMVIYGAVSQPSMSVSLNSILADSNTMDAIKDRLDDLNNGIGDVNDKLDEILKQPDQEKNDAQQGANDAFSGVVNVVPDHSQNLGDAFSGLASSMSYNGTEAKINIPAVSMPGIDGLFDGFIVMQPQTIDFEVYFDMLPDNLLLLVQSLFTAALIVFCFKELYDTIQYVLTLRG